MNRPGSSRAATRWSCAWATPPAPRAISTWASRTRRASWLAGTSVGAALREALADAAEHDLGDWFAFAIGRAMADLDGPPGGGARYPVACLLDGRVFAQFHVDVALGDGVAGQPERLAGHDFLGLRGHPTYHGDGAAGRAAFC